MAAASAFSCSSEDGLMTSNRRTLAAFVLACSLAVLPTRSFGAEPTPNPALLVLNKDDATLAIIDPASGRVVARIATGAGPHELVVSTDAMLAFASNYGAESPGNTISVVDLSTQQERRRVDLAPLLRPHGLSFAGGKLYFTAETNRLVGRYDPAADKVDWLLGTGQSATHMVLVTADGAKMFTANIGSDSITIVERGERANAWNETVVPVGKGPEGLDLSPDGRELWTAHSQDGAVSIIDVESKKVAQTLSLGTKRSNRLKFTPDGRLVLVTDLDAGELVVVDAKARKETKRVHLGKSPEGILMVPDGSRAYVAVTGDDFVASFDLKRLEVTGRVEPGRGPDGMAWAQR
jgi:YVTN family beta-propeller protein